MNKPLAFPSPTNSTLVRFVSPDRAAVFAQLFQRAVAPDATTAGRDAERLPTDFAARRPLSGTGDRLPADSVGRGPPRRLAERAS